MTSNRAPITACVLIAAFALSRDARATCMERIKWARAVDKQCTELKGDLPAGQQLHWSAMWEVCCSAPPRADAGGPDISCYQQPMPSYGDPLKDTRVVHVDGSKEVKVPGTVKGYKKGCGSASHFFFDGALQPGARYRVIVRNKVVLEVRVAAAMDAGVVTGDGAAEDPDLAERGCAVSSGAPTAGLPALLLVLLWAWRRRHPWVSFLPHRPRPRP